MTAKSAPYPPCTVTALWLKYQDRDRMLRRVTQPPHIAGPLGLINRPPASYIRFIQLSLTKQNPSTGAQLSKQLYLDFKTIGFYRDKTTFVHLP
jgi:hypothetical protein